MFRVALWLKSPRPYLMLIGFALFLASGTVAVEVWKLRASARCRASLVVKEWFSASPTYGLSIYSAEYYQHIAMSVWRVAQRSSSHRARVPVGLLLGWSGDSRSTVYPCSKRCGRSDPRLGAARYVMFIATESAVVYLPSSPRSSPPRSIPCSRAVDRESYVRAANCLGASRWQVSATWWCPGRCRSFSPACRSRSGCRVSRWSRRDGFRAIRPRLHHLDFVRHGALSDHRDRDV